MKEQIEDRIKRLDNVGQHAFDGTDYSFGFKTWQGGTVILLKQICSDKTDLISMIEGIKLKRISLDNIDSSAYNLASCKEQAREILTTFISTLNMEKKVSSQGDFWTLLHPRVVELARPRFEGGFYADAVVSCLREANCIIKEFVKKVTNQELDGAPLMTKAFSVQNALIPLADLTTENGRNIQLGYMKIFEGSMIGIRNPKSHENMYPDQNKTIHLLFNASFIFIKLEEAGVMS
jgi:uncharacterized protein (TIGR02391 family)